ncbi:YhjD/YihY/BrkB family envelope integrity protein [uncultured Thiothrix sp.]|jgi:membrane protein|uniref:YihY/virulence factor BrkB family protein n=1 Tax=uncultured Thiothrix sp. TaxID=223185 RepID=UPI00261FCA23|nr:YhjD/YihY/BrkB family envelope integrity protein [uncultured Thiothrix sp.]HMT91997.1 YhjD/YihY/BrkB family envelope integrity protein [Thiolinea sp.]
MKYPVRFLKVLPQAFFYDFLEGQITLRAMGLVYTTLLSLAPSLALSFSVLKGFGVHNQLEPALLQFMAPLGSKAEEVTKQMLSFVDNIQVGVLGIAGLGILLYTVWSLMQQIEQAFNHLWHVQQGRPLGLQIRDYLSLVMLAPILLFTALGLWSAFSHIPIIQAISTHYLFSTTTTYLLKLIPVTVSIILFTVCYMYMPYTKVRFVPALSGAIFAGLAWQTAGWIFSSFVVSSGQQIAIYSVFAGLFLFMLWLYIGWIIVLTGSRLAYYFQYPDAVYYSDQPPLPSLETKELVAAAILREVGQRYLQGHEPLSSEELRQRMPIPRSLMTLMLQELVNHGFLSRDDSNPARYLLKTAPETLSVGTIKRAFWQGDTKQQEQTEQVKQATGLSEALLLTLLQNPDVTMREALDQSLLAKAAHNSESEKICLEEQMPQLIEQAKEALKVNET